MVERRIMAFMSYAHFANEHDKGYLTEFCKRLSGEVQLLLGEEFPIFQDRENIEWGESWKGRIDDSLDSTTFLITIITPGFFKSDYCRDELKRFLEREKKLARNDLVLPVYYVETPLLEDKSLRAKDELAKIIASHKYADWRELRFEELDSKQVRKSINKMATQICKSLDRNCPNIPPESKREIEIQKPNPVEGQVPIMVVDQMNRGDYATISQAIVAAKPGSKTLVKPGVYDEGLTIDKPLEIVGDGDLGTVIVRAKGKNAIIFGAAKGKVSNSRIENKLAEGNGMVWIFRKVAWSWKRVIFTAIAWLAWPFMAMLIPFSEKIRSIMEKQVAFTYMKMARA